MNRRPLVCRGFSLVEVTLALGVAAFCLITVLGLIPVALQAQRTGNAQTKSNVIISQIVGKLRAAVRLPPGQSDTSDTKWLLHPHNGGGAWDPTPDTLFFTIEGNSEGSTITAASVYRATIQYIQPPTDTTSLANIKISWPAQVNPITGVPAGSAETFAAINR
jgi:Tfp pilus assembly protein PilV